MRITPAITPTINTPAAPNWAMTGTSTTVIAPVGPDTCRFEPPNTAATAPATTAVTSPACAPSPEVTPNANANGNATTATVSPASRSARGARRTAAQSLRCGSKPTNRAPSDRVACATLTSGPGGPGCEKARLWPGAPAQTRPFHPHLHACAHPDARFTTCKY